MAVLTQAFMREHFFTRMQSYRIIPKHFIQDTNHNFRVVLLSFDNRYQQNEQQQLKIELHRIQTSIFILKQIHFFLLCYGCEDYFFRLI